MTLKSTLQLTPQQTSDYITITVLGVAPVFQKTIRKMSGIDESLL